MQKSKLLLVDDTDSNLDILIGILGEHYDISVATSGKIALQIITQVKPDLILLDIIMPEMGGYEVCKALKKDPKTADIPIIFVTVKNSIEDEQKGLDLGAIDYITKPFSPPIVAARVKNHLLIKHQRDALERSISLLQHEKELLQQKAELGIFASSFIHDISNILTGTSLIKFIQKTRPSTEEEWEAIQHTIHGVAENIDLGMDICQGFIHYLRRFGESEAREHSLKEFAPILGIYARKYKGKLHQNFDESAPLVRCKSHQIKRVIINLFINAMQAMENTPAPEISFKVWGDEKHAYFSIKDNGQGIPQDTMKHIFDEFFTTKESGTGLGLFMVKQIIDAHEGQIDIHSKEGEGTEFIVALPAISPC